MTRAKFKCSAVEKCVGYSHGGDGFVYNAKLQAVTGEAPSASDEDKSFWAATPNGTITLSYIKDVLAPGQEYYVDFTPVKDSPPA